MSKVREPHEATLKLPRTSVDIWRKWTGPWSKLYHSGLRLCDWESTHLIGPVGMKKRCQKGTPHSPPAKMAGVLAEDETRDSPEIGNNLGPKRPTYAAIHWGHIRHKEKPCIL